MYIINETLVLDNFDFESISYNKTLHNFLISQYNKTSVNIIKAPSHIRNKTLYLTAFMLYLDRDFGVDLTEELCFYLAIHGHTWRCLNTLRVLASGLSESTDIYYWLYLANFPELFYITVEQEMVRREILDITDLVVIDLSSILADLTFKEFPYQANLINQRLRELIEQQVNQSARNEQLLKELTARVANQTNVLNQQLMELIKQQTKANARKE